MKSCLFLLPFEEVLITAVLKVITWTEELVGYSSWGRKESDTTE